MRADVLEQSLPVSSPRAARSPVDELLAVFLLIFSVALVFGPVLQADFVQWDDDINIYKNPHVGGLSADRLKWIWTDYKYGRVYAPFAWMTWSLVFDWCGLNPGGYHLVNLLFHIANTVLVFRLLFGLCPLARPRGTRGQDSVCNVVCAGAGALIWALHPLQVEPVAWATAIGYVQGDFFLLLALLAYLKFISSDGRSDFRLYGLSLLAFCASLLTYPVALGCAPVFLVLDWRRRFVHEPKSRERGIFSEPNFWLDKLPFFLLALLVFGLTLYARHNHVGPWPRPPTLAEFGIWPRVMQGFYCWAYYLWKPLLPVHLSPAYLTLLGFRPTAPAFVLSLLLVFAVSAALVVLRRAWPGGLALWICYLSVLFPFTGQFETPHHTNDRYYYVVSMTAAALVLTVLLQCWHKGRLRLVSLLIAGVATVALGIMSHRQTWVWQNSVTLLQHMIGELKDSPNRISLYGRLGDFYMERGNDPKAADCFREILRINPDVTEAHRRLAVPLQRLGELDEAIRHHREVLRKDPNDFSTRHNLGVALALQGKFEEAVTQLSEAVRLEPGSANARRNLARALAKLGRVQESEAQEREAERLENQRKSATP